MIVLDAFRGVFVPFHLKTVEYYRALLAHMSSEAVVVANLHRLTEMYHHDRNTFAEVFPTRYGFRSESGRQTTLVVSARRNWLGAYEMRENAVKLQPRFDFDMTGVASRWHLSADWDRHASVLRDDFPAGKTPQGAERHNRRCVGDDCPYSTE
jgi:spermidine synthase